MNSSQKNDITLLGNVDIRQVSLAFQDSERIVEMRVEEGAKVIAGQVLAVLDTRTLELQAAQTEAQIEVNKKALLRLRNGSRPEEIGQAQARVDAATTDAKLAELDFQRMQSIAEETHGRGVSRQELDRAAATLKAARAKVEDQSMALRLAKLGPRSEDIEQAAAQLKASEESLALLRHRISLAELKAPTNAIVRSRLAEPGDMASPQKPVYALAIVQPKWISLLDGICPEAAELLKDRQFSVEISRVLRKMKPTRQVECVDLMILANNITVNYAEALLVATPIEMLVDGKKLEKLAGVTPEQMARMEREMANLQGQYKQIEESYSNDVLELTLAQSYLAKILKNRLVEKFIKQHQPDILEQLMVIVEMTALDQ